MAPGARVLRRARRVPALICPMRFPVRALALTLPLALLAGAAPLAAPLAAQSSADSLRIAGGEDRPPLLTRREVVVTGALTVASLGLMHFDPRIQRWIRRPALQEEPFLEDRAEEFKFVNEKTLLAAEVLTWGVGRLTGNEAVADIGLHAAEAVVLTTVITQVVRIGTGRTRPFVTAGDDPYDLHPFERPSDQAYRSFPSIHAATAFATAAAITGETRRRRPGAVKFVAPVSFAIAAMPGLARMYADKHWASDVALGAVWGTTIGMATVRWQHTRPGNRLDRWMLAAGSAPLTGEPALVVGRRF